MIFWTPTRNCLMPLKMRKRRLDEILIERGLTRDKKEAFVAVTEGRVFVEGQKAVSPAQSFDFGAYINIRASGRYVGRGALKLEAALDNFKIDVRGKVCADVGSATGGFTDVLLRRGAKRVYAIDTARGKLDFKLRGDPRVVEMEGTDARDIQKLPEGAELITIDVSLISLRQILRVITRLLADGGRVAALFKPQYETRDLSLLKHGVVKNVKAREKLLSDFIVWAEKSGWKVLDRIESPVRGSKGNVEYLLYLKTQ